MDSKLRWVIIVVATIGALWWLSNLLRPNPHSRTSGANGPEGGTTERDFRIVTLLPKDAIPAVFEPRFLGPDEADEWYNPDELVLGVAIDGEARAYSIPYLSNREIVNDTVGGRKIAVTW